MNFKSLSQRVRLGGALWVASMAAAAAGMLLQILLATRLSPEDYGVMATILAQATLLASVTFLGIPTWIVRRQALEGDESLTKAGSIAVLLLATSGAAITVLISWIVLSTIQGSERLVAVVPVLVLGFAGGELASAAFQARDRYSWVAFWSLFPAAVRLGGVAFLVVVATTAQVFEEVQLALVVASLAIFLTAIWVLVKHLRELRGQRQVCVRDPREILGELVSILRVSWVHSAGSFLYLLAVHGGTLVVNAVLGAAEAGVFAFTGYILFAFYLLPAVFVQKVLQKKLHVVATTRGDVLKRFLRKGLQLAGLAGILAYVLVVVLALAARVVMTSDFVVAIAGCLVLIAVVIPLRFVNTLLGTVLAYSSFPMQRLLVQLVVGGTGLLVLAVACHYIGLSGAVAVFVGTEFCTAMIYFWLTSRLVGQAAR